MTLELLLRPVGLRVLSVLVSVVLVGSYLNL